MSDDFERWLRPRKKQYMDDLCEFIRFPTISPNESVAHPWLSEYFNSRDAKVTVEPLHEDTSGHPDYTENAAHAADPRSRASMHVRYGGNRPPKTLFSAHVDVVPADKKTYRNAFEPRVEGGRVYGRGSADTKGNVLMLVAAIDFLRTNDELGTIALDLVSEEEIGGNGALSSNLWGRQAEEVIVLEPTSLEPFYGHRGCLEFTAIFKGDGSHMGGHGRSAVRDAFHFAELVSALEKCLIEEAKSDNFFQGFSRPVQINLGTIEGGEWRGSIPQTCKIGFSFGFHPKYSITDVKAMIDSIVSQSACSDVTIRYDGIHNGAYLGQLASGYDLLRGTDNMDRINTDGGNPRAWSVSCDARTYYKHMGVPTFTFGAGSLDQAHSANEYMDLSEWSIGAHRLVKYLSGKSQE